MSVRAADPRDLLQRAEDATREAMLREAIHNVEPGNRDGVRSTLWAQLDLVALHELAHKHVLEHKSGRQALEELAPTLGKNVPQQRVVERWLKVVRDEYRRVANERAKAGAAVRGAMPVSDDLPAILGGVWKLVSEKFLEHLAGAKVSGMKTSERYAMLRFVEGLTDAAKVQAEARRTEAQTQNLLAKIRATLDGAAKSPKAREEAIAKLSAFVDELVGIRGKGAA